MCGMWLLSQTRDCGGLRPSPSGDVQCRVRMPEYQAALKSQRTSLVTEPNFSFHGKGKEGLGQGEWGGGWGLQSKAEDLVMSHSERGSHLGDFLCWDFTTIRAQNKGDPGATWAHQPT